MSRPDEAVQSGSSKRILIVDDHSVFRSELQELISHQPDWTVCGQADSAPLALEQMRLLKPNLAVVDVSLGETNRIDLVKQMKAEVPHLPILVLSVHEESLYALRALKAGALGYLMKAEAVQLFLVSWPAASSGGQDFPQSTPQRTADLQGRSLAGQRLTVAD